MQSVIYRIKAGDKGEQVIDDFITVLKECKEDNNCNQLILGCTELPIIFPQCMKKYDKLRLEDIVDSSEAMVETIVRVAKGDQDINELLANHEKSPSSITTTQSSNERVANNVQEIGQIKSVSA